MIKKLLTFCITFHLFCISPVFAMQSDEFNGYMYIEETTVKELEDLFQKQHYGRFQLLENNEFPAIFLKKLPTDFNDIQSLKYRNELFIRILTPMALKINEEIKNERYLLLRLEKHYNKNKTLTKEELNKLEELAEKYDYFVREKETDIRIKKELTALKMRINTIPPSIFVAIAAMETNWGFARVATEANSLYKEKVWYTKEGLEPTENKDDGYRFRIFDSLIDSMRSFAVLFNSDIKFETAWLARDQSEKREGKPIGESIAYTLANASNLPNYAGILDYTTAFYNFYSLDIGILREITP